MVVASLLLLLGLLLLVAGGELLVRGASRLAAAARLSPLFIGLTVVAFGTSAPELAVSVGSALRGHSGVALGNVVGSNIFNLLVVLGLSALLAPLAVRASFIRRDVAVMIAASALLWGMSLDATLSPGEGVVLLAGLIAYTWWSYRQGRSETLDSPAAPGSAEAGPPVRIGPQVLVAALGLALLVGGSELFVRGAIQLAQGLRLSETVIGLTIVAAGTSLPELVTSVVASARGNRDIAVGNVVGSNLFNIFGVQGAACVASGSGVAVSAGLLALDLPVMFASALICLPIFFTGLRVSRVEGALLLSAYVGYTCYLVSSAAG